MAQDIIQHCKCWLTGGEGLVLTLTEMSNIASVRQLQLSMVSDQNKNKYRMVVNETFYMIINININITNQTNRPELCTANAPFTHKWELEINN